MSADGYYLCSECGEERVPALLIDVQRLVEEASEQDQAWLIGALTTAGFEFRGLLFHPAPVDMPEYDIAAGDVLTDPGAYYLAWCAKCLVEIPSRRWLTKLFKALPLDGTFG